APRPPRSPLFPYTTLFRSGWTYEMVAVDDGSTDDSLAVLRGLRERYPMLRVLTFEKNSGQTAALDAGWRAARGKYVVSLDADLQDRKSTRLNSSHDQISYA